MSSTVQIVLALKTTLATVPGVDKSSTDEYLPPINTADTALIIPAFGQESEYGTNSFSNTSTYQTHRFRCEFWVKHKGNNADLTQRARERAAAATKAVTNDPTLGGVVETIGWYNGKSFDPTMRAEIADNLVTIGPASYLPVTLFVTVTDFDL